ncbi:hypothetical protein STVIR_5484 [Streptomyces viridochromogenes Tue57]|uniref:Uncharacterized protein n=1 Tax=Streptomyces viridochromogenes Tue57 TaxID=1160705 RepID=L8PBL7_STRVR|nr:hypothetical protein STVIR_5484 [Streptomyces viridochromogenes Tue57]
MSGTATWTRKSSSPDTTKAETTHYARRHRHTARYLIVLAFMVLLLIASQR